VKIGEECVLDDDKICDGCGECERCDLDHDKICDNCGKCLNISDDAVIKIDAIITDEDEAKKY